MDFAKEYGYDAAKEIEGIWTPLADGAEFRIARAGNDEFKPYHDRLQKAALGGRRELPQDVADDVLNKAAARTLLKDWRGDVTYKGEPLPYSEANALLMLRTFKDFREFVLGAALNHARYKADADEADAKN